MGTKTLETYFSRVSFLEKLLFTKHLSLMIQSGISLSESLEILVDQTKTLHFKKIISRILKSVQNGQSLSKSFAEHENIFDRFYLSMLEIGEESGTLEKNLNFLSSQMSKAYTLRKKIQTALIYPGILISSTFIIGGFIAFFILPQLVDFFAKLNVKLPLATRILLVFAQLIKDSGIFLLLGSVVFILLSITIVRFRQVRPLWHRFLLYIPVIGLLLKYEQLANFSRNLGTLLQSGVPITRSLETTSITQSNENYKKAVNYILANIKRGHTISGSLSECKGAPFPPIVIKMVAVGEKSGKLEETLLYLGDFYEDEIDNISNNLSTILEPILLLGIGLVVGVVALAIISPIYELTGSIGRP